MNNVKLHKMFLSKSGLAILVLKVKILHSMPDVVIDFHNHSFMFSKTTRIFLKDDT